MKVLFDPQVFSFQDYGGISRYYCEMLRQFRSMDDVDPSLIIQYSNNRYLPDFEFIHTKQFFPSRRFKGRNEIIKFLNRSYVRNNFRFAPRPNVFHPTYYDPYFLDILGDIPFVLTIYDMSHELYPQHFSKFDYTAENKKIVAAKAHRIIAISEHTKKDIVALYHIPDSQIDVIPLATNLSPAGVRKADIPLPHNYLLYVGARNTYKNFSLLLGAMQSLSKTTTPCSLVCAGGGTLSNQELNTIRNLGLSEKIIQMNVDDALLAHLYSNARAFVFPSFYEGFGIPVLEAFACGCPALLSNRSCLPEVGGDAAKYFDPESIPHLVEILNEVIENKSLADDMRTRGLNRVKLFSWNSTARKTIDTYKKVLC
jgi:glycosyltransferase involved in cell wall biosynthesis